MTRRTSRCRISSTTHHNGRRRGHREVATESTHTLIHICHRPRVPGGHVLVEHRCAFKHCKTRGSVQQTKQKDQTHHTNNNNKKVPFQITNKNKNNTCETCDPTNLEMSYIFNNTPQRKAPWPTEREREYTYCLPYLSPQTHPKHRSHRTDGR